MYFKLYMLTINLTLLCLLLLGVNVKGLIEEPKSELALDLSFISLIPGPAVGKLKKSKIHKIQSTIKDYLNNPIKYTTEEFLTYLTRSGQLSRLQLYYQYLVFLVDRVKESMVTPYSRAVANAPITNDALNSLWLLTQSPSLLALASEEERAELSLVPFHLNYISQLIALIHSLPLRNRPTPAQCLRKLDRVSYVILRCTPNSAWSDSFSRSTRDILKRDQRKAERRDKEIAERRWMLSPQ